MDGRGSVVPNGVIQGTGRGRNGAYYTTLHLALHIDRCHPCPVSVRRSRWGSSILTPYPLPLRLPPPVRGESSASRSTLERKIFGPSFFSTKISVHLLYHYEPGQRWFRSKKKQARGREDKRDEGGNEEGLQGKAQRRRRNLVLGAAEEAIERQKSA